MFRRFPTPTCRVHALYDIKTKKTKKNYRLKLELEFEFLKSLGKHTSLFITPNLPSFPFFPSISLILTTPANEESSNLTTTTEQHQHRQSPIAFGRLSLRQFANSNQNVRFTYLAISSAPLTRTLQSCFGWGCIHRYVENVNRTNTPSWLMNFQ